MEGSCLRTRLFTDAQPISFSELAAALLTCPLLKIEPNKAYLTARL